MRLDLSDDPAVLSMCSKTGLDSYAVIGRLHKLWSWANRHLVEGEAPNIPGTWIDRYVECEGFAGAMSSAGWLTIVDGGISFPKFDSWNSGSAKRRLKETKRKQTNRTSTVRNPSASDADKSGTRQEESREEINTPLPPTVEEVGMVRALGQACGADPKLPAIADRYAKVAADLLAASYGPQDVARFAKSWRKYCPGSDAKTRLCPTLNELAKNIGGIRSDPKSAKPAKKMPSIDVVRKYLAEGLPVDPEAVAYYGLNGVSS